MKVLKVVGSSKGLRKYLRSFKKETKPKVLRYVDYIVGKEWREKKIKFFNKYGKKCFACNSFKNINVHHLTYRNIGKEKDEDLVVLCRCCHEEYHDMYGVSNDMTESTTRFILDKIDSRTTLNF